jgi:hypothetical protein
LQAWAALVGQHLARKTRNPPRVRPYRDGGDEYLACDYDNFSMTLMVTGGTTTLFDPADVLSGNCTDMEVHDMTDALLLVYQVELARSGRTTVDLG